MSEIEKQGQLSRRRFLQSLSLVASGTLLAGCSLGPLDGARPTELEVLDVVLPSSSAVASATDEEVDTELSTFLILSALLTGVDDLDPAVGRIYLQSLQANPALGAPLAALMELVSEAIDTPITLAYLEENGVFENQQTRQAADKLTEYWYTGVYEDEQGQPQVAAYVDALAWKTLTFTKAMSVCGTYRFWTEPPEFAID